MKLYVATRHYEYEGFVILGIFSNRDVAQAICEKDVYPEDDPIEELAGKTRGDGHSVEEFTLDVKSDY